MNRTFVDAGPGAMWEGWEIPTPSGDERVGRAGVVADTPLSSGFPVLGRRLVEVVLQDGLGIREIQGRRLVEMEFDLGGSRAGGEGTA
jgi:hypothetical protein